MNSKPPLRFAQSTSADQINNVGGYLRSLTDRAGDGKFSTWPMVMALLRAKLEAGKYAERAEAGQGGPGRGQAATGGQLQISEARRTLDKQQW